MVASHVAKHLAAKGTGRVLPHKWHASALPSAAAAATRRPSPFPSTSSGGSPSEGDSAPTSFRPLTEVANASTVEPPTNPVVAAASASPLPEMVVQEVPGGARAEDAQESHASPTETQSVDTPAVAAATVASPRVSATRNVPSHPLTRAMHFGGLGLGLAAGAAAHAVRQAVSGSEGTLMMNDANVDRLASALCRLRGAALKVCVTRGCSCPTTFLEATLTSYVWRELRHLLTLRSGTSTFVQALTVTRVSC